MTQAFDDDLIGGRYRLVRQVGQGGMGTVWQALDELLDRTVAIKQLASPFGTAEERAEQVERIKREAKMAARLDHTGVVRVYDIIDWSGSPAIVMEYIRGRSLAVRLRETVGLGTALLDALQHAHGAGVVHRDLKPDNVLLDGTRVVITDFGIARPLDGATTLTRPGALIGTPAFMAPEQIEGGEATAAADLWSLGVTLYTAVEGDRPFKGETMAQLCMAVLTQPMPAPRHAGPLTPLLEALLARTPKPARTPSGPRSTWRRPPRPEPLFQNPARSSSPRRQTLPQPSNRTSSPRPPPHLPYLLYPRRPSPPQTTRHRSPSAARAAAAVPSSSSP